MDEEINKLNNQDKDNEHRFICDLLDENSKQLKDLIDNIDISKKVIDIFLFSTFLYLFIIITTLLNYSEELYKLEYSIFVEILILFLPVSIIFMIVDYKNKKKEILVRNSFIFYKKLEKIIRYASQDYEYKYQSPLEEYNSTYEWELEKKN